MSSVSFGSVVAVPVPPRIGVQLGGLTALSTKVSASFADLAAVTGRLRLGRETTQAARFTARVGADLAPVLDEIEAGKRAGMHPARWGAGRTLAELARIARLIRRNADIRDALAPITRRIREVLGDSIGTPASRTVTLSGRSRTQPTPPLPLDTLRAIAPRSHLPRALSLA